MNTYSSLSTIALSALALVATPAAALQKQQLAFQFTRTAAYARVDPIRTPGQVAEHVHRFLGGSYVLNNATYETLQMSNCSTVEIQADKSAYWMPALYHISEEGTYTLIEGGTNIVYYGTNGNPTVYPENWKMLTGSPTQTCDEGPDRYYVCINDGKAEHLSKLSDITGTCDSIGMHIIFPSCWDGKDFDHTNQNDHLVMPTEGSLGDTCPSTHKIKLPYLMMDMFGDTAGMPKNPNGPTWTLSTNDTEGCGMHADFVFGWDRSVLAAALDECVDFTGDMRVNTCGPLKAYDDLYTQAACQWQAPVPDEDVGVGGTALSAIPSCGHGINNDLATCKSGPDFVKAILVESEASSDGGWQPTLPLPVSVHLEKKFKEAAVLGEALLDGKLLSLAEQTIVEAAKKYLDLDVTGTTTVDTSGKNNAAAVSSKASSSKAASSTKKAATSTHKAAATSTHKAAATSTKKAATSTHKAAASSTKASSSSQATSTTKSSSSKHRHHRHPFGHRRHGHDTCKM